MCSCFNPILSLGKVFWLAGSLLIIGLASVVNPTIGWRWLIRIASIPGILLILVFKVGRAPLSAAPPLTWCLPRHQQASPFTPCKPGAVLVSSSFHHHSPLTQGTWEGPDSLEGMGEVCVLQTSCWGDVTLWEMAWLCLALQSPWLRCPVVAFQHPRLQCPGCQRYLRTTVMGQALGGRQTRQDVQKIPSNIFSPVLATAHPLQPLHFLRLRKEASVKCSQSKWVSGSTMASPGLLMLQKY